MIALVVLAAIASAAKVGSASATDAVAAKSCSFTLRVGDVLPFTGGLAAYGANLDRAVKVLSNDLVLKGLIMAGTGLRVGDEHLRALLKQWNSDKPDDSVKFTFNLIWV